MRETDMYRRVIETLSKTPGIITFTYVKKTVSITYNLPVIKLTEWNSTVASQISKIANEYYERAVTIIITDSLYLVSSSLDPNLIIIAGTGIFKNGSTTATQGCTEQFNITLCNNLAEKKKIHNDPLFVTRIFTMGRYICLEGVDEEGKHCMRKTKFTTGVWVSERIPGSLNWFMNLKGVIGIEDRSLELGDTTFNVNDFLLGADINRKLKFRFVETDSWHSAFNIYKFINTSKINKSRIYGTGYKYTTFGLWDPNVLMHLEFVEDHKKAGESIPNKTIIYKWLDSNYRLMDKDPAKLNIVAFDIETVTHNASRFPLGELPDDVIYIICAAEDRTNTVHTWYIGNEELGPNFSKEAREKFDADELERVKKMLNKKPLVEKFTNNLDINYKPLDQGKDLLESFQLKLKRFESEKAMLEDFVSYLQRDELIILAAHNGRWYDYPVVAQRYRLLNCKNWETLLLEVNGCPVFGTNIIPFDSYIYAANNYEMDKYTLNNVVQTLLGLSKADVSAVDIRYTWKVEQGIDVGSQKYPSKAQAVYYCKVDSVLVLILLRTQPWILSLSDQCSLYMCDINHLQSNEVQETRKIMACLFLGALQRGKIFPYTHNGRMLKKDDGEIICYDDLKYTEFKRGRNITTYTGGLNWYDRPSTYENVSVNDYQQFFPFIISVRNLSPETTIITTPRELVSRGISIDDALKRGDVNVSLFAQHKHPNGEITDTLVRMYIMKRIPLGLNLTYEDYLNLPDNQPIVVTIDPKVVSGFLSSVVSTFVTERAGLKQITKNFRAMIEMMELRIRDPIQEKEEFFDFDDEEEDEEEEEEEEVQSPIVEAKRKFNQGETISAPAFLQLNFDDREKVYEMAKIQYEYYQGVTRTRKTTVSSFYGVLGSTKGYFSAISVAGATTCRARAELIELAQYSYGYSYLVTYMDTDSVFLAPTPDSLPGISISAFVATRKQEINPKEKEILTVLHKKCYTIMTDGSPDSRGVNRNGPKPIREFLYYVIRELWNNKKNLSLKIARQIVITGIRDLYGHWIADPQAMMTRNNLKTKYEYPVTSMYYKMIAKAEEAFPGLVLSGPVKHFPVVGNSILTGTRYYEAFITKFPLSAINLYLLVGSINKMLAKVIKNLLECRIRREYNSSYIYEEKDLVLILADCFREVQSSITRDVNIEYLLSLGLTLDEADKVILDYETQKSEIGYELPDKEFDTTYTGRVENDIGLLDLGEEW